ncbi:coiled-coil domain-containing protein [Mycobacterium sp. Aquia_213]|uniref:coiled-coil domain-containing protein n=1 Tax=Mycobacterium sp. Aquia_213 TaxID=2991728 RepID=UPI00226E8CF0|nr:secretion protein EspK [Mycobacterium sp. Aquia_213]WAC93298.1 secretion protein EspK [Mycobacterium sp. Aquia_213]
MSIVKPTGQYAERMLEPNGWPQVDEGSLHDRAQEYTRVLSDITEVLQACQHQQIEIFEVGVWTGAAAGAAGGELATRIDDLTTLQSHVARVIAWQRDIAGSVVQAKSEIGDNVELAHRQINELENDSSLDAAERTDAIDAVVSATHAANVSVVTDTAEQIMASKQATPPAHAARNLLHQQVLPREDDESAENTPAWPASVAPAPIAPVTLSPSAAPAGGGPRPTPQLPPLPGPALVSSSTGPASVSPAASAGGHAVATPGASGMGPAAAHGSATPHGGVRSKGVVSVRPLSGDSSPGPADETAMPSGPIAPAAPMTPAAAAGGQGAGSGSRAPIGQAPSGKPSGVRPAATAKAAPRHRAAARRESTESTRTPDIAAVQLVSVSTARAARDAIADATGGSASRRAGSDGLRRARHVAAALNAHVAGSAPDMGFFWVTAVTTDGEIVVANSYGLAYIPDGVQLPEKVHMASADETIPASDRARWATYPVLAVQAWASHRNTELRAVIGTETQLANCDPGVAKIVLRLDDIPDSGEMDGRTRLEVVDPAAADRLAATPDRELLELIPAAPVGNPPASRRAMLWLAVMQPLASELAGRQAAHLRAMHAYAVHTQEVVLHRAHTAADPVAQRGNVADWLYWNHLATRLDVPLAEAA